MIGELKRFLHIFHCFPRCSFTGRPAANFVSQNHNSEKYELKIFVHNAETLKLYYIILKGLTGSGCILQ